MAKTCGNNATNNYSASTFPPTLVSNPCNSKCHKDKPMEVTPMVSQSNNTKTYKIKWDNYTINTTRSATNYKNIRTSITRNSFNYKLGSTNNRLRSIKLIRILCITKMYSFRIWLFSWRIGIKLVVGIIRGKVGVVRRFSWGSISRLLLLLRKDKGRYRRCSKSFRLGAILKTSFRSTRSLWSKETDRTKNSVPMSISYSPKFSNKDKNGSLIKDKWHNTTNLRYKTIAKR